MSAKNDKIGEIALTDKICPKWPQSASSAVFYIFFWGRTIWFLPSSQYPDAPPALWMVLQHDLPQLIYNSSYGLNGSNFGWLAWWMDINLKEDTLKMNLANFCWNWFGSFQEDFFLSGSAELNINKQKIDFKVLLYFK